jgi:chromosome transmission fidelity protein 1
MTTAPSFSFPVEPYDVQVQLMTSLYASFDAGAVGVFESPTGTGKSLSIVCAALKWLADHRDEALPGDASDDDSEHAHDRAEATPSVDPNDWVAAHFAAQKQSAAATRLQLRTDARRRERARLAHVRAQAQQQTRRSLLDPAALKRLRVTPATASSAAVRAGGDDDDQFLLLEPRSAAAVQRKDADGDGGLAATRSLLPNVTSGAAMRAVAELLASRARGSSDDSDDAGANEPFEERKVYYCARTHSQLSQFIEELRRTSWVTDLKCVPLGARKNMCVNESVLQLRDATQINDRCDELRRCGQCPYVSSTESAKLEPLRDTLLATQPDIEAAVEAGTRASACSYYAARAALPHAELVVLPYQLVVQREAREALGLTLRGNVVILDECHNVPSAISSSHEAELDGAQLDAAHAHLEAYLTKYASKLSVVNVNSVRQLLFVCRQLARVLSEASAAGENSLATQAAFVFRARIDNLNLFELERYFAESQIVRKVQGFTERAERANGAAQTPTSTRIRWSLAAVRRFLGALTATEADARVLIDRARERSAPCVLRCVMLSAARPCLEMCAEARAVAFCGGTVAPRSAFVSDLFGERIAAVSDEAAGAGATLTPQERAVSERLRFFSCGHVVPRESVCLRVLAKGPSGVSLNFAFAERSDERRVGELGAALANLCAVVPHGVVVFFTSYAYEAQVMDEWTRSGVLARLSARKAVHRDRRVRGADDDGDGDSDAVSALLGRFAADARSPRGALLTAVMGGRLSEGINFKDELARCVVVVGVPFPPAHDVLFDEKVTRSAAATGTTADDTRTRLMNDAAMKTVNQAIGRALRHRGDYAAIVLADERFARPSLRERLPQWLAASLPPHTDESTYGAFTRDVAQFFARFKRG